MKRVIRHLGDFRWEGIPVREYKPDATHFRDVTRQLLCGAEDELACELRYFEIAAGGHSTLEKHEHAHAVVILQGRGRALVDPDLHDVGPLDLVRVPPSTWHQFKASDDGPLGFLCLVNCERDRPVRPTESELASLRRDPLIAEFLRS